MILTTSIPLITMNIEPNQSIVQDEQDDRMDVSESVNNRDDALGSLLSISKTAKKNTADLESSLKLGEEYAPNSNDVICARGKRAWDHEGNVRFRALVEERGDDYRAAKTKLDKTLLVSQVMEAIEEANPPGRFVKLEGTMWTTVGLSTSREKIGQTFRDLLQNKNKQKLKRSRRGWGPGSSSPTPSETMSNSSPKSSRFRVSRESSSVDQDVSFHDMMKAEWKRQKSDASTLSDTEEPDRLKTSDSTLPSFQEEVEHENDEDSADAKPIAVESMSALHLLEPISYEEAFSGQPSGFAQQESVESLLEQLSDSGLLEASQHSPVPDRSRSTEMSPTTQRPRFLPNASLPPLRPQQLAPMVSNMQQQQPFGIRDFDNFQPHYVQRIVARMDTNSSLSERPLSMENERVRQVRSPRQRSLRQSHSAPLESLQQLYRDQGDIATASYMETQQQQQQIPNWTNVTSASAAQNETKDDMGDNEEDTSSASFPHMW